MRTINLKSNLAILMSIQYLIFRIRITAKLSENDALFLFSLLHLLLWPHSSFPLCFILNNFAT